ncbi:DUF1576 domain-containing protein [Enterococcus sp. 669A]|uniref:DUF1576 domain-containing protein n=1 Tax=Candidatus Enterococcus moelleringii TaxID=2815325 RepID=A0ABS3LBZ4_9ENTE|nr:DUF1576 domain-containing protein [Enterococcus sp. 669A]MBO1307149.1 DUF1576 domain-containing protein [Enterococcus sp. 669A]
MKNISLIKKNDTEEWVQQQGYLFLFCLSVCFIGISLAISSPKEMATGLKSILFSPAVLLTDYSVVGCNGSAFFNSGFLMLFCTSLLKIHQRKFCEEMISAVFALGGYAFFGKNIYCLLPIMLGTFLYAKIRREPFSKYILVGCFGGALSPVIGHVSFSLGIEAPYNIMLAYLLGAMIGFVLPPLTTHFFHFHKGKSLYSVGFASGIVGIILLNIFKVFSVEPTANPITLVADSRFFQLCMLAVLSLILIVGLIIEGFDLSEIKKFSRENGHRLTNQLTHCGFGMILLNMAFVGFLLVGVLAVMNIPINGILFGTIMAVVGYSARGMNVKSIVPILLGASLILFLVPDYSVNRIEVIMALLFSIGLSPITTNHGCIWGFVAGMFHLIVAPAICGFHGGLSLYNSGLASGLIAGFLSPLIELAQQKNIVRKSPLE